MSKPLHVRPAELRDLPDIVRMLADDALGAGREKYEDPLPDSYLKAFDAITQDRNNELVVVEGEHGRAVGVMQLTFTPVHDASRRLAGHDRGRPG